MNLNYCGSLRLFHCPRPLLAIMHTNLIRQTNCVINPIFVLIVLILNLAPKHTAINHRDVIIVGISFVRRGGVLDGRLMKFTDYDSRHISTAPDCYSWMPLYRNQLVRINVQTDTITRVTPRSLNRHGERSKNIRQRRVAHQSTVHSHKFMRISKISTPAPLKNKIKIRVCYFTGY